MTTYLDKDMEHFFSDNDSFVSIPLNNLESKRPSEIMEEYKANGPRKSDPYNTDDSTDADTEYNENDISVTSRRKPEFIQHSLFMFRKRIKTLPEDVKDTFTGKEKRSFFCCFKSKKA